MWIPAWNIYLCLASNLWRGGQLGFVFSPDPQTPALSAAPPPRCTLLTASPPLTTSAGQHPGFLWTSHSLSSRSAYWVIFMLDQRLGCQDTDQLLWCRLVMENQYLLVSCIIVPLSLSLCLCTGPIWASISAQIHVHRSAIMEPPSVSLDYFTETTGALWKKKSFLQIASLSCKYASADTSVFRPALVSLTRVLGWRRRRWLWGCIFITLLCKFALLGAMRLEPTPATGVPICMW